MFLLFAPVLRYVVQTVTGAQSNAGTRAHVFVNLFGEMGDTGERRLLKSRTNSSPFDRRQVCPLVLKFSSPLVLSPCVLVFLRLDFDYSATTYSQKCSYSYS